MHRSGCCVDLLKCRTGGDADKEAALYALCLDRDDDDLDCGGRGRVLSIAAAAVVAVAIRLFARLAATSASAALFAAIADSGSTVLIVRCSSSDPNGTRRSFASMSDEFGA